MTMALLLALSAGVKAQYVTYNHDECTESGDNSGNRLW